MPAGAGKEIPRRISDVLGNLQRLYAAGLVISEVSPSGATFYVRNLTDHQLMQQLFTQKVEIFGAALMPSLTHGCVLGPADFQILAEQVTTAASTRGILLRYLPAMPDRADYLAGYWFY